MLLDLLSPVNNLQGASIYNFKFLLKQKYKNYKKMIILKVMYKFIKWILLFSLLVYLGMYYPNAMAVFIMVWITYKVIF